MPLRAHDRLILGFVAGALVVACDVHVQTYGAANTTTPSQAAAPPREAEHDQERQVGAAPVVPSLTLTLPAEELTKDADASGPFRHVSKNETHPDYGDADFVVHVPRKMELRAIVLGVVNPELRLQPLEEYRAHKVAHGEVVIRAHTTTQNETRLEEGDYVGWVAGDRALAGTFTVVAWTQRTPLDGSVHHGEPQPNAATAEHALKYYMRFWDSSADLEWAYRAFTTLPKSFFVYAARDFRETRSSGDDGRPLPPRALPKTGEPLLVWSANKDGSGSALTSDGEIFGFDKNDVSATTSKVTWPAALRPMTYKLDADGDLFSEGFRKFARPDDPRVVAFVAKKERVSTCANAEWKKRDPHHDSSNWDVVSANGSHVERLNDRIAHAVGLACGTQSFMLDRNKLEVTIRGEFEQKRRTWQQEVVARFP